MHSVLRACIVILADRTNGCTYATVLRPSVCRLSVCLSVGDVYAIVAKRCILPKNCMKKEMAYGE